ncbi:uncharacterized protein [Halyomorpha halys]|uniref:uncharacterized protein n=1 Tax=Halyomorpha halys TaxID=286706 RepID=UPI0034D253AD
MDLLEQLDDLAEGIMATTSMGCSLSTDPSRGPLLAARLSRIDTTFEHFETYFLEANSFAGKLYIPREKLKTLKDEVRNNYYKALAYGNTITVGETSNLDVDKSVTYRSTVEATPQPRLPTINIPVYSGDIAGWQDFKETFKSLIHSRHDIDDVQKFHYLKSVLKGSAMQNISAVSISPVGYKQAWESLTKKYDSERIQATFYLTKILNFKRLEKGDLSNLEAFSAVHFGALVIRGKTREDFEREYGSKPKLPTWEEFAVFIQRQAVRLQSEALLTSTAPEPFQTKTGYSKCTRQVPMKTDSPVNSTKCPACKKSHRIYDCPSFKTLTPQQRCDCIRGLHRCINCLASGHFSNQCSSKVSCRHCGRRHHSLLHFFSKESRKSESPHRTVISFRSRITPITAQNSVNNSNTALASANPSAAISSNISDSDRFKNAIVSMSAMGRINVLLGTALAKIRDHRGRWHDLRILIDSGSQRSFITAEWAQKLNLPLIRYTDRLVGFNNQVIPNVTFEAPCVIAPQHDTKPELNTAVVIERICEDMPTSPIPKGILEKFSALHLADPHFHQSRPVDFLLGADLFADILRVGNLKSGQGKPRALETIFGWIIMGPINGNPMKIKLAAWSFIVQLRTLDATISCEG